MADMTMEKSVAAAGNDVRDAKREADLDLANEKCDAMSGDAKHACQADAKARFGKL